MRRFEEEVNGQTKTTIEQIQIFAELPYQIAVKEYEKTGLDMVFFG